MIPSATRFPASAGTFLEYVAIGLRLSVVAAVFLGFSYFLYRIDALALISTSSRDLASTVPPQGGMPVARPAGTIFINDDAEVIGICIEGHARAYLVRAMSKAPSQHVVNDLLEGRPVSVTFCDRNKCSHVFTDPSADRPLDLEVGGWKNNGMTLRVRDQEYAQESGENLDTPGGASLPYAELPHARTTWRDWWRTHPDTDVYTGEKSRG
jgi:hypothetical protein